MNQRITWEHLPARVRAGVEEILGESVTAHTSQQGGFSPGSADRVVLASGRRAFVKAASSHSNQTTPELHRREAAVTAALPAGVPAPQFLGMYDDGTWVALVLSDVAGHHPHEPWVEAELMTVLDTLARVSQIELAEDGGAPEGGLPLYQEDLRAAFRGWEKVQARPLEATAAAMDPWAAQNLSRLAELAARGTQELAGNSLVHGDLRTDNMLLTGHGVVLLDWPWAARGASWVDALSVLINVKTHNPAAQLDHLLTSHKAFAGATADSATAVLAGWAGYFLDMSRRPAPEGIPTLRPFQRRQADVLVDWIKTRD